MAVIYFMFFIVTLVAALILVTLILTIKSKPKSARIIEIVGYVLLIVSIIWTIIVNLTTEMSADSDLLRLDEKLNVIWSFEGDKKDYIYNNNSDDLSQDYKLLHEHWTGPVFDDTLVKMQYKIVKYISYGLFALSTLFISAGRLSELLMVHPDKSSTRKYPKYKRNKRSKRIRKFKL
ncbi:hypothetical protein [Exiguobacterium chiriqhucha]|uniref:hypothetical protein n=1 Tax=Exiguobacterium chiriqhucha TaxID=1385984 RepID=UPI0011817CB0|nr:hypothetical protein [Exiguobacterium chiriqhucha]